MEIWIKEKWMGSPLFLRKLLLAARLIDLMRL